MAKPLKHRVRQHPQALILKEWPPNQRVQFDHEWFDTVDHLAEWFDNWCEDSADLEHPVVIAEVLDTDAMTLGRVVSLPDGDPTAAAHAEDVRADPSLLLTTARRKAKADLSWVTDLVATGGDFAFLDDVMLEQLNHLLDQNLALVIDCRQEADDAELWGITAETWKTPAYVHLPTDDAEGWVIPPEHFATAVTAATPVLDSGGRVFVHCHMGVNRGPSTAYAVLLSRGHGITEAFDLIRAARPIAGIAYAPDALRWWAQHQGWDGRATDHALVELDQHMTACLGPKEIRVIEHAVRTQADSDQRQVTQARL